MPCYTKLSGFSARHLFSEKEKKRNCKLLVFNLGIIACSIDIISDILP